MTADYLTLVKPWDIEEQGIIAETPIFSLRKRFAASKTYPDKKGTFVYIDSVDWVNVVAVTAENQIVMIEQFRHGRNEVTLEIPGGMVDAGEDALTCGQRELAEETGYTGPDAKLLGTVTPNPAIQNNRCHTILVNAAALTQPPHLDGNEEIGVRLVDVAEVSDLVRRGVINHALVVAGLHHYLLNK